MLTIKDIQSIKRSDGVCVEDFILRLLSLEKMEGYFRRERKENLKEQGWKIPEDLISEDDEFVSVPQHLKEHPNPDARSRYSEDYDGGEIDYTPHYGSLLYWQQQRIKQGKICYVKAYGLHGLEIPLQKRYRGYLEWKMREYLLDVHSNSISGYFKDYEWFMVKTEDLGVKAKGIAFFTCYLFLKDKPRKEEKIK
jgi:hypothetical protein